MLLVFVAYVGAGYLRGQYSPSKFWVIIFVCLLKLVEAYADVYYSRYQQLRRLDVAAKTNAPKYAIDAVLDDTAQACYNFIFMPVFVIGLLANFVFNPILVKLAYKWDRGEIKVFTKVVVRQIGVIAAITLLAISVALTIGCPVLGWLYNVDLHEYRTHLTILMVGGGMLALANFFTVVVTVVRGQKHLMVGYVAIALVAKILSHHFVSLYGIMGAVELYTGLMTLLALVFAIVLILCVKKRKK